MIVGEYDGRGTMTFIVGSERLAGPAGQRVMRETLRAVGLKTRTGVRRALKQQMGTRRVAPINSGTRSYSSEGGLAFSIEGSGKGLPITEFPVRYSRSKRVMVRWSPREHWRVQDRDASGRFGSIKDVAQAGISASPWGKSHQFKRSFVHPSRGPVMVRVPGKRGTRKLFGPAIGKEIVKDDALAAFHAIGPAEIARVLPERMARLLP